MLQVSQGVPAPSLTKRRSFLKDPKAISLRKSIVDRSSIPTSAPSNPTRQASGVPSFSIREGPPTHSEELHTPYEPVPAPSHYQSTPAGTHAQPSSINPVIGNSNLSFSSIEGSDVKVQQVETDFSDISEVLASRSITPSNKQRRRSGIPTSGKVSFILNMHNAVGLAECKYRNNNHSTPTVIKTTVSLIPLGA